MQWVVRIIQYIKTNLSNSLTYCKGRTHHRNKTTPTRTLGHQWYQWSNLVKLFYFQSVRTNLRDILTHCKGTANHPNRSKPTPRKNTAFRLHRCRRILSLAHLWRIHTLRDRKCILPKQPPVPTNIQVTQVNHRRTMKSRSRKSDFIHYNFYTIYM